MMLLVNELSAEFKDAWLESLYEEGWGGFLGREEDLFFWMWCAAGRQQI